jgi:PleD family two-component response regulator
MGASVCEPVFVGGQIIGSVLVASARVIKEERRDRLRESVAQAAPILANQRSLTLAETAARSDSLTGLANRRAADVTLRLLIAKPLATALPWPVRPLDLDGLKQINDRRTPRRRSRAGAAGPHHQLHDSRE